jgi:hypothetical protein
MSSDRISRPSRIRRLLGGAALSLALASPAAPAEIWLSPVTPPATNAVGNWGVSNNDTRFSFSVPENLAAFQSAHVVVLGKSNGSFTYDLSLSISQNLRCPSSAPTPP